jgi:hypothetical protein
MLIDSNIIIYAAKPEHSALRQFIGYYSPAVSHNLTPVTRNTKDFAWIPGIALLDTFEP